MDFLVVSRISIPATDRTLPAWEYLRSLGHTVTVEHPGSPAVIKAPDVIISMGVTIMEETFLALERFPGAPLYCMNWDCYFWIWEPGQEGKVQARHPGRPNEYDYRRYGDLLKAARQVWVPSRCTGLRTTQWWGLTNWEVILSACPWWDYEVACDKCFGEKENHDGWYVKDGVTHFRPCGWCHGTGKVPGEVTDDGYALCTLREIPDPYWGRLERACADLKIPLVMTRHEVSYAEYQDAVAGCSFLVSPLYELSTGGLTLLEGYRLGKPCLLSDSPWHGGRDYMGGRAHYFRHDDEEDFRNALATMWRYPQSVADDHRAWVEENFSDQRMIDDMLASIKGSL